MNCNSNHAMQQKNENIKLTRELIRVEKGQLRINAFLALITAIAVLVAIFSTIKSINLTRETSRLDQRAWVAVTLIEGSPVVGEPFSAKVVVKNTGKTFAKHLTRCCRTIILAQKTLTIPIWHGFLIPWISKDGKKASSPRMSITSVVTLTSWLAKRLRNRMWAQINNGDIVIVVFGKIVYRDVFDCEHWTTFCFRYEKTAKNPFGINTAKATRRMKTLANNL